MSRGWQAAVFRRFPGGSFPARTLLLVCLGGFADAAWAQRTYTGSLKQRYLELCASCHGKNLEGVQAPSMLDDDWTHGGDDESLARSIRNGIPDKNMPAWSPTLSEKEIRAFVVYLREERAHYQRSKATFAQPPEAIAVRSALHDYQLKTWVAPLNQPWSLAFLPGGGALVTEKKPSRLLRIDGDGRVRELPGLPPIDTTGDCGLMDVVLHPDFARNGWIYLACSDPPPPAGHPSLGQTRIIRGRERDGRFTDVEVVYRVADDRIRAQPGSGGRMAFDRAGHLYFSIGDHSGTKSLLTGGSTAQKLDWPTGKVHRVFDDGRIPADNPFRDHPDTPSSVWTYGHRNPQGLAFHPLTGELYSSEHGPRGGDEINRLARGANYGWPVITHGMHYNGTAITEFTAQDGMEQPVVHWTPSIAPSGISFYTGDLFPRWKNHLFVAALAAEELRRIEIRAGRAVAQEILFKNLGRVRHVVTGPDGALYVLLPGRIARLSPAE
jgi:glucose/arabinose dehydrogenase